MARTRRLPRGALLSSILLLLATVSAGPPPGDIESSEYRSRRLALAEALRGELPAGGRGVLILPSVAAPENLTFRQESNLYYLTGTEIPGSSLVLLFERAEKGRKGGKHSKVEGAAPYAEFLYLPERDSRQERWTGARPGAGGLVKGTLEPDGERREAMKATGFEWTPGATDTPPRNLPRGPIGRSSDLPAHLDRFLRGASVLFTLTEPAILGTSLGPDLAFLKDLKGRYPLLTFKRPEDALTRLRLVKSPAEIARLRRAIEITCQAQRDAMRQLRPGMAEHQIQAVIEYRFLHEGARRPGYPPIVGSGPNSCVLHYDASERTAGEGEVVLIDVGAEYRRYTADVTRTLPVNGRFTDEQRRIYDVVLEAQKQAIALIRPGLPFGEIHRTARKVIGEAGYGPHFNHGTSHFIGLDVHDVGGTGVTLLPGMVLTVEPGIYIREKGIGVRIEDDVLVTPEGAEVLSDCVPREADAVEMQMAEGLKSGKR